jgi:hypothetical protein
MRVEYSDEIDPPLPQYEIASRERGKKLDVSGG